MVLSLNERDESHRRLRLRGLLKPKKSDLLLLIFTLAPHIYFYSIAFQRVNFQVILTSRSGLLNTMMAKTLYNSELLEQFNRHFEKHHMTHYQVLPLHPLLYRIVYYLCFRSWKRATMVYVIGLSILCNFVFSRFVYCARFIKNPIIPSLIFTVYPFRSLFLRSVTNEYCLVIILFCLIYIGKQTRSFRLVQFSSALMILSYESGFLIILGFIIGSILSKNRKTFRYLFYGFICGSSVLSIFHKIICGRFFPLFFDMLTFYRYPFQELLSNALKIGQLRQFHGLYGYYIIPLIACLMMLTIEKMIGIPLLFAFLYAASYKDMKAIDLACPIEAIATIVGFDALIKHPRFKNSLFVLAPLYILGSFYLTGLIFQEKEFFRSVNSRVYTM
ncbi:hypothetical protein TRFO_26321 [Tritrichomonas foetus]|uniref:Glycosyltransferase RgtA/B/C/D-like domain-containing protein n=1 Tax=Tritrichomonas foetus TaxID=1144522 RepID=A0A1J4K3Q9_9EUKA|nr:hypothetical protein TRFO_26321 [Tritrichomonas foetus]|eukprot:OHT05819.1 hypothetical protein TRFO_26321 [Tritrichomonas foetus]